VNDSEPLHLPTSFVHRLVDKINAATPIIHHVVSTAMCCGWGKMDPEVAATQVRQAYDVWARTRGTPAAVAYDQLPGQYDVYFHQANMEEQPDIYQNLDLKKNNNRSLLGQVGRCRAHGTIGFEGLT
jgi:hypothetical protein